MCEQLLTGVAHCKWSHRVYDIPFLVSELALMKIDPI